MTKHFCDACGREITDNIPSSRLDILCHIAEGKRHGHVAMVDGEMVSVSGRDVHLLLCCVCYNKAAHAAMDVIKQIRKDHE